MDKFGIGDDVTTAVQQRLRKLSRPTGLSPILSVCIWNSQLTNFELFMDIGLKRFQLGGLIEMFKRSFSHRKIHLRVFSYEKKACVVVFVCFLFVEDWPGLSPSLLYHGDIPGDSSSLSLVSIKPISTTTTTNFESKQSDYWEG